jgi:hypothetical protein
MNLESRKEGLVDWKLGTVVVGVMAALVASASFAFADGADGGHCSYGNFSVNVMPSCNSDNGGGGTLGPLSPATGDLHPTIGDLHPAL